MGVIVTLPNTLSNNTNADAGQVMANFNALVTALASAADTASDTFTGDVTFDTYIIAGSTDFRIIPKSGGDVGIPSANGNVWAIKVTDNGDTPSVTGTYGDFLQALSGGYKVQSSSVSAGTSSTTGNTVKIGTFSFPTPFSSASGLVVVPTLNSGMVAVSELQAYGITASGFDLYANVTTANTPFAFNYVAIGD